MADHYLKSLELLDEHDAIGDEIRRLYEDPPSIPLSEPLSSGVSVARPAVAEQRQLNALYARQRTVLTLAKIHAVLSVRQALQDSAVPL